jgi:hypothetical protein
MSERAIRRPRGGGYGERMGEAANKALAIRSFDAHVRVIAGQGTYPSGVGG